MNCHRTHRPGRIAPALLVLACGLCTPALAQQNSSDTSDEPRLITLTVDEAAQSRPRTIRLVREGSQVRVVRSHSAGSAPSQVEDGTPRLVIASTTRDGMDSLDRPPLARTSTSAGSEVTRVELPRLVTGGSSAGGPRSAPAGELDDLPDDSGGQGGDNAGDEPDEPMGGFAWTPLAPSRDTRFVYVSSSEGSDTNDGLSERTPVKTIRKARDIVRQGMPDWLMLKRGDVFEEGVDWWKSGRSEAEPMVVTAYGQGERPVVAPPLDKGGFACSDQNTSHVAIVDIAFVAPESGSGRTGILFLNRAGRDILIEGCLIDGFKDGLNFQYGNNIRVRGNVITDSAAPFGGHSQGMYALGCDDLLVEGNVFDHNGWRDDGLAEPTMFNHNLYLLGKGDDPMIAPIVRNNIFSRGSSFGVKVSAEGTPGMVDARIENNLYLANANGMELKYSSRGYPYSHKNPTVRGNVFTEMGRSLNNVPQSFGLFLNSMDGGLIEDNFFVSKTFGGTTFSVHLRSDPGVDSRDTIIRDNIAYNWAGGGLVVDLTDARNITVDSNIISRIGDGNWQVEGESISPDLATFTSNAYDLRGDFRLNRVRVDLDDWQHTADEHDVRDASSLSFVEPTRDVSSYLRAIGHPQADRGWVVFVEEARRQSKASWRSDYSTENVLKYIRKGFSENNQNGG